MTHFIALVVLALPLQLDSHLLPLLHHNGSSTQGSPLTLPTLPTFYHPTSLTLLFPLLPLSTANLVQSKAVSPPSLLLVFPLLKSSMFDNSLQTFFSDISHALLCSIAFFPHFVVPLKIYISNRGLEGGKICDLISNKPSSCL